MNFKYLINFLFCCTILISAQDKQLEQKAREIHEKVFTIDTHTDTPFMLKKDNFDIGKTNENGRVDFPRMKKGGLDAVFFAVFTSQNSRTPENNKGAYEKALELTELIKIHTNKYPELAELAFTPEDGPRIEKEGKRAIYIGMENGFPLNQKIERVKEFYDLGVRYITLCHTKNNDICDSSNDKNGPEHNGLSKFGEEVVKKMNELKMIIDVSHISDKSFFDVMEVSEKPVIASHSNSRSVCDHPRNMTDEMLKKLAEKDGVIQLCVLSSYVKTIEQDPVRKKVFDDLRKKYNNWKNLSDAEYEKGSNEYWELRKKYPEKLATVADLCDHIDYIKNLIGVDYIGIGTDFDGGGGLADCRDASELVNISIELVKRGYTEDDLRKIWGGNFLRVFKKIVD